jgi:hypothetical protein
MPNKHPRIVLQTIIRALIRVKVWTMLLHMPVFSEGPFQTLQASKRFGGGVVRSVRPGLLAAGLKTASGGAKAVFIPSETANLMPERYGGQSPLAAAITARSPGRRGRGCAFALGFALFFSP